MSETIEARLTSMGITLPEAAAPAADYLPYRQSGNLLFVSGQLPMRDGAMIATGRLGDAVTLDKGSEAARMCAINILAQVKAATGDLDAIKGVIKITVFVASTRDFTDQHLVANGASALFAEALGEKGRHARAAVGTPSLPLDAPVEVEAIIEI